MPESPGAVCKPGENEQRDGDLEDSPDSSGPHQPLDDSPHRWMNRLFARGKILPGPNQPILHLLVSIASHCSQRLLCAREMNLDGGDGAIHRGGDVAIELLFA